MTDAINSHSRRMYNAQKNTRADLATPMRCAECDCEKGGADCNWIATPAPAVKVKALVWVKGLHWTTDDDGGRREGIQRALHCWTADQYRIIQQDSPDGLFILRGLPKGCVNVFPYFEPASAAAQADYEARVTPALEPANPLDDPRVKALVEAAREVKADCIARADKHGVVPIGRGAWDQLTAALSALEESK